MSYRAPLRVGVADGMAQLRLSECFAGWRALAPDIPLEITEMPAAELSGALRREEVDIGFSFGLPDDDAIAKEMAWDYPLVALLPPDHELATRELVQTSELLSFPMIACRLDRLPGLRRQMDAVRQHYAARPVIAAEARTLVGYVIRVAAGLGVGVADAGHMAADALALSLAVMASWLAARKANKDRFPYGFQRAQVLAGFVNGLGLVILVFWLWWEAFQRLMNPHEILAGFMLSVAVVGLAANLAAFWMLHGGDRRDLNMRGALLNVMADIFGSVAAIISAIVIYLTGWLAIDAVLTLIVSLLILRSAFPLLDEAARVLLQAAPKDFKSDEMIVALKRKVTAIRDVHQLQVWLLTPEEPRLAMHIRVDGPDQAQTVLHDVKNFLAEKYNITHSTIQIECPDCPDQSIFHDDDSGVEPDEPERRSVNGQFKVLGRADA